MFRAQDRRRSQGRPAAARRVSALTATQPDEQWKWTSARRSWLPFRSDTGWLVHVNRRPPHYEGALRDPAGSRCVRPLSLRPGRKSPDHQPDTQRGRVGTGWDSNVGTKLGEDWQAEPIRICVCRDVRRCLALRPLTNPLWSQDLKLVRLRTLQIDPSRDGMDA